MPDLPDPAYRGLRNLGRTQKLVLSLLASEPRSARELEHAWPTLTEQAARNAIQRLVARGLADAAGRDRYGHGRAYRLTERGVVIERLLAQSGQNGDYVIEDRGHDSPCWIWQRAIGRRGYGQVWVNGKTWIAHRFYYETHVGPVPEGRHLHHLCGNALCVNPAHLEVVTQHEHGTRHGKRGLPTSEEPGVSWCAQTRKWRARLSAGRQNSQYLGTFATEQQAIEAVREAREVRSV